VYLIFGNGGLNDLYRYEVLDNTGKIIISIFCFAEVNEHKMGLYANTTNTANPIHHYTGVGEGFLPSGDISNQVNAEFGTLRNLTIRGTASGVTVTYDNIYTVVFTTPAEVGANFLTPTTFRLRHQNTSPGSDWWGGIGVSQLVFGDG